MKSKSVTALIPFAIFFVIALASCGKVSSPTPPSASGTGATPAIVQVTLASSVIASGGSTVVTATVLDSASNPVPNTKVSFSVISATTGTFTPGSVVTNASGQATATFTAGATVNAKATIRASVTVGTSTINGSAQITVGTPVQTPTSILVSVGTSTINPTPGSTTVTATVKDSSGGISGIGVTFTVSDATAGVFSQSTVTTDASGVSTTTFTANAVNKFVTIAASAGGLSNSVNMTLGTPPPPTPTTMSLTSNPMSIGISSSSSIVASLKDSSGNPAFGAAVTFLITGGTGTGSLSSSSLVSTVTITTDSSGNASTVFYAGTVSGTMTIQATAAGLPAKSVSLLITSDPASISLDIVKSSLVNGETTNVTADVRNIVNGAVNDGTVVTFAITSLPPYAGSFSGSATTSASTVNGIASVTFTADASKTGGVIIQATVGTLQPAQGIIIVNPAQAGSLEYVSVTPSSGVINVLGAGSSTAFVKFKVLNSSAAPLPNQNVNFSLIGPNGATLGTNGLTTDSQSSNAQGEVTVQLNAGVVAGPVRIIASTAVTGPPASTLYASSGSISIGGGVPSYKWLSLSTTQFNIPGLACDGVTTTINVKMADRFGNYNILAGTSVSFATDYGAIDTSNITDANGQTSVNFRSQDPRSADGEVTILVQTTGEENFTDMNANGVYDPGIDGFSLVTDDLPEPYIDSNHSGSHDPGELFFDWPSSVPGAVAGTYDSGNGVWDPNIPIWKSINIWMTGPPDASNSYISCWDGATWTNAPLTLANGASTTCIVYAADANDNALVSGTKISLQSSLTDLVVANVSGYQTLPDGQGTNDNLKTITYTITNKTKSASDTYASLTATIDWPSNPCNSSDTKLPITYGTAPGSVSLITLKP